MSHHDNIETLYNYEDKLSNVGCLMNNIVSLMHPLESFEFDNLHVDKQSFIIFGDIEYNGDFEDCDTPYDWECSFIKVANLESCVVSFLDFTRRINAKLFLVYPENKFNSDVRFFEDLSKYKDRNVLIFSDSLIHAKQKISRLYKVTDKVFNGLGTEDSFLWGKLRESFNNISNDLSSQEKFNIMLGEFIYFSAKHLLSKQFLIDLNMYENNMLKQNVDIQPAFYLINTFPKGYPYPHFEKSIRYEDEDQYLKKEENFKIDLESATHYPE
jgi:hypothetical protein